MAGTSPATTNTNRTPPFHRVHFESIAEKLKHRAQKSDLPASRLAAAGTPC